MSKVEQKMEEIAKKYFYVKTLKTRNMDELDFYNIPIWNIKKALEDAYHFGFNEGVKSESDSYKDKVPFKSRDLDPSEF